MSGVRPAPASVTGPDRALVVTVVHHPEDARIRHREIGALLEAGFEITYAAPFLAHGLDLPDVAGLRPLDLPHASGRTRREAMRAARELLRTQAPEHDVVIVHDPELLVAALGLGLRNLLWDVHEDTVASIETKDWVPARARRPMMVAARALERHAERHHDLVLAEHAYADRFEGEHLVVPNTVRVPERPHPPGRHRAVYLGSVTMARGAATLVQVGRRVTVARRGSITVEVIGPARDERTAEALAWAVKSGHLHHHGFVPSDAALPMLDGALAGLSLLEDRPNYRHSMPTKVIEYMAHGLPVITTPLPLARDLVTRAGCGVVVPFGDAEAVTEALVELAADPERRAAMGRAGHRYAREHHDWNVVGHEFVAHVRGLARAGRATPHTSSSPPASSLPPASSPSPASAEPSRPTPRALTTHPRRHTMFDDGIAVIGLGYIGLPTCAALTGKGLRVIGVDVDPRTVAEINAGRVPIVEPNLDEAILEAVDRGLLTATTEMPLASVYLIAVPTPFQGDHEPDLRHVRAATEALAPRLRGGEVVILESTSPPGTTELISQWISDLRPDLKLPHMGGIPDVHLAHCPERVLPGRIMVEIFTNDRVVGGLTPECAEAAAALYRTFVTGEIVLTDAKAAEMAKLTENAFRDVNIAFANELAEICEHLGVDVWEVISMANHHPRVSILQPGPGVGGHCIAVDPWFIVSAAPQQARLIRAARETNDARPRTVLRKVDEAVTASGHDAVQGNGPVTIACLGLAFKADVDDLRESPALAITRTLAVERPDARILVVEPHVSSLPAGLAGLPNVELVSTREAVRLAEVVVLLVDHTAFRAVRPIELRGRQVVDTRGLWRVEAVAS